MPTKPAMMACWSRFGKALANKGEFGTTFHPPAMFATPHNDADKSRAICLSHPSIFPEVKNDIFVKNWLFLEFFARESIYSFLWVLLARASAHAEDVLGFVVSRFSNENT